MRERVRELWREIGDITRMNAISAARNAVAVQTDLLGAGALRAGVDLNATFARVFGGVAEEAAQSVITGAVYQGRGAMLSKRIWHNAALQSGQLSDVIAAGVLKQQSPMQLARALEAFVRPDAAEPSNWNDVYTNLPFAYNVEYNAKRLAVASINHAAWSGTLIAARNNPYAEFLHWELTPSHGIPDICDTYADHEEGLGVGNYPLSSAPLPHPFCTCLWFVDTDKTIEQVADELKRWEDGERVPALDRAFGTTERATIPLAQQPKYDIIGMKNAVGSASLKDIGTIPKELYAKVSPNIRTEELIITQNRIEHIIERRGLEFFNKYYHLFSQIAAEPDYIFKENDQTALACKMIHDGSKSVNIVIRIAVEGDDPSYKNSIITAIEEGEKRFQRRLRNNIPVYKRE